MTNLRECVRGWPCQVRLPGICNRNDETTVGAHFRLIGTSGMGIKSPDLLIAAACSACHGYCDTHHDSETQLALAQGVFRTQALFVRRGIVRW